MFFNTSYSDNGLQFVTRYMSVLEDKNKFQILKSTEHRNKSFVLPNHCVGHLVCIIEQAQL